MGSGVTVSTVCELPQFLNNSAQVRDRACGVVGHTEQPGLGAMPAHAPVREALVAVPAKEDVVGSSCQCRYLSDFNAP